MTKMVLDSVQAPGLAGLVPGQVVEMNVYAIIEAAHVTEEGYVQFSLDIKGIEVVDKPKSMEDAGKRAAVEVSLKNYAPASS